MTVMMYLFKSFEEIYNEANKKLNIRDKAVFIEHAKRLFKSWRNQYYYCCCL